MTGDSAVEAPCIIHENNYWHDKPQYSHTGKCIVGNYVVLSVTLHLYIAGMGTLNKVNGQHVASNWKEANQAALVSIL